MQRGTVAQLALICAPGLLLLLTGLLWLGGVVIGIGALLVVLGLLVLPLLGADGANGR